MAVGGLVAHKDGMDQNHRVERGTVLVGRSNVYSVLSATHCSHVIVEIQGLCNSMVNKAAIKKTMIYNQIISMSHFLCASSGNQQ